MSESFTSGQILVPCPDGSIFASVEEIPTSRCFRDNWIGGRDPKIDKALPAVQPIRGECRFLAFEFSDWMMVGDAFAIALDLPNDHSMVKRKLFSEKGIWTPRQIDQLVGRQHWKEHVGLPRNGSDCIFPVVDNNVQLRFVTVRCDPSRQFRWVVNLWPPGMLDHSKNSKTRIFLLKP